MDSEHLYGRSKRMGKERNNKMNESQQQKKPEKESFGAFGFLLAVLGISLLAMILKLVGLF
jgi:hypothetical protein